VRSFVASPATGFRGKFTPKSLGREIDVISTLDGDILDPDDPPVPGAKTLAEHKATFWDPTTSSLKFPHGRDAFTIGPEILRDVPDTAVIVLRFKFVPTEIVSRPDAKKGSG